MDSSEEDKCVSASQENSSLRHVEELKTRLHQFLETLDSIEPETADLEEIDKLIQLVDELEKQMEQAKDY